MTLPADRPPTTAPPEAPQLGPIEGTKQLAIRTVRSAKEDRVVGLAAEVAFFTILSLPPLILALFGLAGFIGDVFGQVTADRIRDGIIDAAGTFLAEDTIEEAVIPTVDGVLEQGRADVALLGLALALWSGSRATNVAMRSVTLASNVEPRAGWKRRMLAIGVTVVAILVGLAVIPLIVIGPQLGELLGVPGFHAVWRIAYWPTMGILVTALIAGFYNVAVPWKTPWYRDLPGATLAVALWLACAAGLRVYTAWTIRGDSTFGPLATPIIILLWLYVTAVAVIMGAELNAEIERLWPRRRTGGEATTESAPEPNAAERPPEESTAEIPQPPEDTRA